jgi:hypothetical protein
MRAESELNKRLGEESQASIATGDDALWRAYTWTGRDEDARVHNGVAQVRTAGGAWVNRSYYDQAVRKFGGAGNTNAYQQALSYEMQKAATQEEQDHLIEGFATSAQNMGMSQDQMIGVWKGAAFAKQNENRQWKYYNPNRGANGDVSMGMSGLGLVTEIDEKQGSYAGTMQNADTWTTMSEQVNNAHEVLAGTRQGNQQEARETITRAARVADSLSSGGYQVQDDNAPGGYRDMGSSLGAGAPGRVAEEMRAFHEIATAAGEQHGFDPDQYGTQTRSDSPYQSQDDRDRPSVQ